MQMVMPSWFTHYMNSTPGRFGTLLALAGILVLTPDTLVIRLSGLERWTLMGWRGILMGTMSFIIWWLLFTRQPLRDLRSIVSWQGLFVVMTFSLNSVTFTLGIVETSASVVLTAVATMPVFAAILSSFLLQEKQGWLGWTAIFVAMGGVAIVVIDGGNAIGRPQGSVALGALYGVLTAIGLAVTFTMARKYTWLAILPAAALGAFISGLIGVVQSDPSGWFDMPLWTALTMGLVLLPVSFTCLNLAPRYTSAAIVSLVMLLEMVIGPFWVWLGIGERPSPTMIIGTAIVLGALAFHILRTEWFTVQPQTITPPKDD
jgi:drug/metabolite transporter (DMT)-like permease